MQKAPMKTASHRCEAPRFDGKVKASGSQKGPRPTERTREVKGGNAQGGHSPSLAQTDDEARGAGWVIG